MNTRTMQKMVQETQNLGKLILNSPFVEYNNLRVATRLKTNLGRHFSFGNCSFVLKLITHDQGTTKETKDYTTHDPARRRDAENSSIIRNGTF